MHSSTGLHHLHKRKRIHVRHEQYPHPNKVKRAVDSFAMLVGALGPLITIPQITKIWGEQNAAGVSIVAWVGYTFIAAFWLIYGALHKEAPLMLTYSIVLVLNIFVVLGIFLYG
jgi:MtN3 and saliva related transmembrane protein